MDYLQPAWPAWVSHWLGWREYAVVDVAELGVHEGGAFAAEDHAGNKTTVPAFPVDHPHVMEIDGQPVDAAET